MADINQIQISSDPVKARYDKLEILRSIGRDPFEITVSERDTMCSDISGHFEEFENKTVIIAGRIMSKRVKGKVAFLDIHDKSGKVQVFAKRDNLGEEEYALLKRWDVGDITEIKGFVFKTQTGEVSVHAQQVKLLSKSLLPLPEKFHGLTDTDTRYRQRYVDLIMNDEVKDTFIKRSKIIYIVKNIRN